MERRGRRRHADRHRRVRPDRGGEGLSSDVSAVAALELKPALEAVLMVVDEPATEAHLAKVLERTPRGGGGAARPPHPPAKHPPPRGGGERAGRGGGGVQA
ncbi:hypothetical protein ACFVZ8_22480, partial [Streptomyces sp. NPDC059558]